MILEHSVRMEEVSQGTERWLWLLPSSPLAAAIDPVQATPLPSKQHHLLATITTKGSPHGSRARNDGQPPPPQLSPSQKPWIVWRICRIMKDQSPATRTFLSDVGSHLYDCMAAMSRRYRPRSFSRMMMARAAMKVEQTLSYLLHEDSTYKGIGEKARSFL